MSISNLELGWKLLEAPLMETSACIRPPTWPPEDDWVVSEDSQGNPVSRWGDPFWDFSAWAGLSFKLHFAEGKRAPALGLENQHIMRMSATWMIWGPKGETSWSSLKSRFWLVRRILELCERHDIVATNLHRFPQLLKQLPDLFASADELRRVVIVCDRLYRAKDAIGLTLLDEYAIATLAKRAAELEDDDETEQTAYIPPRIWTYQILRLRECLDDFLQHKHQIEECFHFCLDAYAHNLGSLEAALLKKGKTGNVLPFSTNKKLSGRRTKRRFYGGFEVTARKFGIFDLLQKWIKLPKSGFKVTAFSSYLSLIQYVGIAYITNFTLQRKEEVGSLRYDCLTWETDPVFGRMLIICGETTKTDPDSDARWPASPSVEIAVEAMRVVAKLRMECASKNPRVGCSEDDKANPYLYHRAFEPWSTHPGEWQPYSTRARVPTYKDVARLYPLLFDTKKLEITEDDLKIARRFTPNLNKGGTFAIGKTWPLGYHELRRTGGVNMYASGLLSETSIQVIMKHSTVFQTRYYGKNFSKIRFNEEFEKQTTAARYEVIARQIETFVEDRYVRPASAGQTDDIIVDLLAMKDFKALVKAAARGEIPFREIRLGGCTNRGHCDYGGIESVARCAGGDGFDPCRDAAFDKTKRASVKRQLESIEQRLGALAPGTPRSLALQKEANGLRNFLNTIEGENES
jgi:hypothetical protein